MAMELGNDSVNSSFGLPFLVAAGIVYEIIAAACSSPQTTEINASSRADTLMKWVYIGLIQSALFITAAACFDRAHRVPIVAGGVTAGFLMWLQYKHAREAGLKSGEPGTES
jgi:hypothetical protein